MNMAWRFMQHLQLPTSRSFLTNQGLCRFISTTSSVYITKRDIKKAVAIKEKYFDQEIKNKETFLELLQVFKSKEYRTGHNEFVYAALNHMEAYGVEDDLECYKQIIDVMPKGKMMATNVWLADFQYFPKHQQTIVDVLCKMEMRRIRPDREMFPLLVSIFGKKSSPTLKYLRMMYWMPKLRHISPWPAPEQLLTDQKKASEWAVKRICSVDVESEITVFQTKDDQLSTEDTWIVNGQSRVQKNLIKYHPENLPMYVDGPFKMYLGRKNIVDYYVLKADMPKNRRRRKIRDPDDIAYMKIPFLDPPTAEDLIPEFSVHEQRDGIIYAVASMGSSSKNCLQSWIRFLQKNGNSRLGDTTIVFRCNSEEVPPDQSKLLEIEDGDHNGNESSGVQS